MDVTRWEKLLATCCEPAIASSCLTLRAVAISTGVVGDGAMSAASALIEMSAEHGSAAAYVGARLSGGPLAGRLAGKRSRPPWCRSAYHRYASGCLETAMRLACGVIRASAHAVPRAVLG